MATCPACGRENPAGFRFCGFCTAPLAAPAAVTILVLGFAVITIVKTRQGDWFSLR